MTLSIYRASIPVFLRGLDVLSILLDRANAHAEARKFDVDILLSARLAPDMLPFTRQIQRASDTAKFAARRLTDLPSASPHDNRLANAAPVSGPTPVTSARGFAAPAMVKLSPRRYRRRG